MEYDKEQESSDIMCDVCHKTFRDTCNLKEMPLFKMWLCLIGSTFNSVNILSDVCVCVCVCVCEGGFLM
jgi:hypothetical protein